MKPTNFLEQSRTIRAFILSVLTHKSQFIPCVLHKIGDANVISRLKRSLGVIDDSLWGRLPNLAPGQALVSMSSFARPLLINIDPTPCKLRMVE